MDPEELTVFGNGQLTVSEDEILLASEIVDATAILRFRSVKDDLRRGTGLLSVLVFGIFSHP